MTTPSLRVPRVFAAGRWWFADQIEAIAASWHAAVGAELGDTRVCAAAIPSTADGIALFVALAARPAPLLLLSSDPRLWPAGSALFAGMPLVLPPNLASCATAAARSGFVPVVLPDARDTPSRAPLGLLQTAGIIVLTSGSTGAPKPVYRPTSRLMTGAAVRNAAIGLEAGEGVICGVPLSSGQGLVQLVATMLLGGGLGLLAPLDHRAALAMIARPEFSCWRATPHFADVLGRCPLSGPAVAPRICLMSSPVPTETFDTFRNRFGVPLRQSYSSSETGVIAIDGGPPADVVPGTVGRPVRGAEVRLGDHPDLPLPTGGTGRIWVRSAWQMAGYGLPPDLDRPGDVGGWWPTRDVGSIDESGRLRLSGRIDDCVRTRDGRLVDLAVIADAIRAIPGVRAAVVLPTEGSAGAAFGAVVQCRPGESVGSLREQIASTLPAWGLPRTIVLVADLPRMPTGKPDRLACLGLLSGSVLA